MKLGHHRDVRPPGSWKPKKTGEGFTPPPSQACVADENLLLYLCLLLLLLLVQLHAIPDVNIFKSEDDHTGSSGGRYADHDHLTHGAAGQIAHMNVGSNQGVKVGDYFRAVRAYEADLRDPVDSISFKASTVEETQKRPPSIEAKRFTKGKGPQIHVRDLPRRAVGEVVVIGVTPTTATGMIVFALEDVHVGDGVELDEQQQQQQAQVQQ